MVVQPKVNREVESSKPPSQVLRVTCLEYESLSPSIVLTSVIHPGYTITNQSYMWIDLVNLSRMGDDLSPKDASWVESTVVACCRCFCVVIAKLDVPYQDVRDTRAYKSLFECLSVHDVVRVEWI